MQKIFIDSFKSPSVPWPLTSGFELLHYCYFLNNSPQVQQVDLEFYLSAWIFFCSFQTFVSLKLTSYIGTPSILSVSHWMTVFGKVTFLLERPIFIHLKIMVIYLEPILIQMKPTPNHLEPIFVHLLAQLSFFQQQFQLLVNCSTDNWIPFNL